MYRFRARTTDGHERHAYCSQSPRVCMMRQAVCAAYLIEVVFQKHLQAASVASLCAHDRRSRIPGPSTSPAQILLMASGPSVFVQDRAMCGKGCPGRSSNGGTRASLREVAQNRLEWVSSTVAASNRCTSRDLVYDRQPMRARTRDDCSAQPGDLKGTKGTAR